MYENDTYESYNGYETSQNADTVYAAESHELSLPAVQGNAFNSQNSAPKKKHGAAKIAALAICCSLLGGIVGAAGAVIGTGAYKNNSAPFSSSTILIGQHEATVLSTAVVNTGKELKASEVYAQNVNSTVGITTSVTTNYFGYKTMSAASGSGFILTADGYIITNHHVIEDASTIKVTTYDGTEYDAKLIGSDEDNDIAVLKIEAEGLSTVILGSSDDLSVGDDVVAIGNPLGELTFSMTKGIVSALDREVTMSNGIQMNLIQTDCAINSGNSGGPMFNMYGEVVGITNAKYSNSGSITEASIESIGFAIPIDSVKTVIMSIIEKGYVAKPYIGVTIESVSSEMLGYGLPEGAVVRSVAKGSPAEAAGLRESDIVTKVNGESISGSSELKKHVSESVPGDELTLTVYRRGETLELKVTVDEQQNTAEKPEAETAPEHESDGGRQFNGFGNSFPWQWFFG